jgi:flagella basal body P-ring formation protein FlgA
MVKICLALICYLYFSTALSFVEAQEAAATLEKILLEAEASLSSELKNKIGLQLYSPNNEVLTQENLVFLKISHDPKSHKVKLFINGGGQDHVIPGRYWYLKEAAVAKRFISAGEVIKAEDFHIQMKKITSPNGANAVDASQLVGKKARRPINAHKTIRSFDLEQQNVVQKGDVINVALHINGILVSTNAEVVVPGKVGQHIKVKANSKIFKAKLLDRKNAELIQ